MSFLKKAQVFEVRNDKKLKNYFGRDSMYKMMALLSFSCFLVGTSLAQDCTKLQPQNVSTLEDIIKTEHKLPSHCDNNSEKDYAFIIFNPSSEAWETKRIKSDQFKNRVKIQSSVLYIDDKKMDASKVSLYEPNCARSFANSFYSLGCNNPSKGLSDRSGYWKSFDDAFKDFSNYNSPFYTKSIKSCQDKIQKSVFDQVEEYVRMNGGRVLSIKDVTNSIFQLVADSSSSYQIVNARQFEVEIINNGVTSVLKLEYPFVDRSQIRYKTPAVDAFGEYVPESIREVDATVETDTFRGRWGVRMSNGETFTTPGNQVGLYNDRTSKHLKNFNLDASCKDQYSYNQNNSSSVSVNDELNRDNNKPSTSSSPAPAQTSGGAISQ
jgi:hypothetical protein